MLIVHFMTNLFLPKGLRDALISPKTKRMSTIFMHIYNPSFKLRAIDCANTPIAVATGSYEYNNYYYYAFEYACSKKWEVSSHDDNIDYHLRNLGLKMVYHISNTIEETVNDIKELVKQDKPVIFFIPYNKIFYTQDYNTENSAGHGLLFIGYIESRDSYMIMDSVQMWGANQDFTGGSETFIRLPLSKDVFYLMMNDCADKSSDGLQVIKYYTIEKEGKVASILMWS